MHGLDEDELPGRALPPSPDALSNSLDPDADHLYEAPTQAVPLLDRQITAGSMVGPYLVQRLLADGGMGRVYLAEDRQGVPVALKVLNLQNARDPATQRRFDREGEILARLNHPNIVRLLGRGVDEPTGRAYLALEFVPGQDLSNLLQRCQDHRLSVDEAVFVVERCARALAAAHAINVLHRDMKPANVLVTRDGQVKLTDFGVALLADDPVRLTAVDHVMGTLPYLAPEVLVDGVWTSKGDVYGLGCLAFKLMAGQPPFPQRQVQEVVAAHRRQQAPSLMTFVPDAPPALADLLARMLAKVPDQRPTAAEVERGLRDLGLAERTARVALEWSKGRVGVRAFPSGRFQAIAGPPPPTPRGAAGAAPVPPAPTPGPLGAASGRHAVLERVDRYEVVSRVGRGAMGEVYLVRGPAGGPPLALKLLSAELVADLDARERFRRELDSMSQLEGHPGIVSLRGHGALPDGRPYYVMDYVEGQSLKQAMRTGLSTEQALDVLEQVAGALGHAHARGFVHRDVKPENILLDRSGRARLADFGLVKALAPGQRSLTLTGELVGTPAYMAPEQAVPDLGAVGPPTDVFALGAMLYEALAGAPPYIGATAVEVYSKLIEGVPVAPPRAARPDVAPTLEALALRAISRGPSERPADATAFLAELRAARAGGGSDGGRSVRLLVTLAAGAGALGLAAVATLALRRPAPEPAAPAPTQPVALGPRIGEALARGDVAAARALVTSAPLDEAAPWVLALAGEPARGLEAAARRSSPPPAHHVARVAAWAGDAAALRRALDQVTPPERARALAHELGVIVDALRAPALEVVEERTGWAAVAEGEARLARGDVALAALAFDAATSRAGSDADVRLAAALGSARVALGRGDLPAAQAALERAAADARHALDVGRCALWRAALTAAVARDARAPSPIDLVPAPLARARDLARQDAAAALAALREPGDPAWVEGLDAARAASFVEAEAALALAGRAGPAGLLAAPWLALTAAAEVGADRAGAARALAALEVVARLDPASAPIALAEARAALVLDDLDRAGAALERARAAARDDARVALVAARLQASRAAARALELDLARLARAPGAEAAERDLADAWAAVAQAARDVAARAASDSPLAVEARTLAARASLARVDRLRRSGLDDGRAVLDGARRALASDVAAATSALVAPLSAARAQLVRALLTAGSDDSSEGGSDGAPVALAEAALAEAVAAVDRGPGLAVAEEALALAGRAGRDGGDGALAAYFALAGDAPARALRRALQASAEADEPARVESLRRAVALAPDLGPVLVTSAGAAIEAGQGTPRAAVWLARAASSDVDLTWGSLRLLSRRTLDAGMTARLADEAAAAARDPLEAAVTRALVLAAGAGTSDAGWRAAAAAAAQVIAVAPGHAVGHVLRALALARVGLAAPERGAVDARLATDVAHALACARAAAPGSAAPAAIALHVAGVSGVDPGAALERLLAQGYLRNYRALLARPEGGPDSAAAALIGARLEGNLAAIEGGFEPSSPGSPRGPWALARRLEEQRLLPRLTLALRLHLVAGRDTPAQLAQEVPALEALIAALPPDEAPLRDGVQAVFFYEAARDDPARRADHLPRAARAALRARAARPAGGPPPPRDFAFAPRPAGDGPADREVGLALEGRARRPALLIVARAAEELGLLERAPLLSGDDLAAPWSHSRAALDGPRDEDVLERAVERLVRDRAWDEVVLALLRVAAFPGDDGDHLDEQLRDAIEDEVVDEVCWERDAAPEDRRAAWRVVAAAAADGREAARDPRERAALTGLLADALLHEAGCLPAGSDRDRLLARARALTLEVTPERVAGRRRPLEAAWRRVRCATDEGWADALADLGRRLDAADDDDRRRLLRRAALDPLYPSLSERPDYRALVERAGGDER